jgi:hypothetical protein
MPGGKRTDRISKRDLEVLEFIARFGIVPRSAVALWAGTARTVTITRESRLRRAGLLEHCAGIHGESQLLRATRLGLRMSARSDLRPACFSLVMVSHNLAVATLAASLERAGFQLFSERELLAREREAGRRLFSAKLAAERFHRPDLICLSGGGEPPEAIEVELTAKAALRLDEYLLAWGRAVAEGRFSRVVYCCSPQTRSLLERAIERTHTQAAIAVQEL